MPLLSLDPWHGINFVAGMNCTSYLKHQRITDNGKIYNGTSLPLKNCQPWHILQHNVCQPGDGFDEVVDTQPGIEQPLLLLFYCMTTADNLTEHRDVMGGCLLTTNIPNQMRFFPLPCNVSELNKFMCADL